MKKKLNINAKEFRLDDEEERQLQQKPKKEDKVAILQKQIQQKEEQLLQEPVLEEDPRLGFWSHSIETHANFKQQAQVIKKNKMDELEKLRQNLILEQRKRGEQFARQKEKQQRRRDPLGMVRINKLIHEMRLQYGKNVKKVSQKKFTFAIDEEDNIKIVEKEKVRKPSKLQKAKQSYLEDFQGDISICMSQLSQQITLQQDNSEYETVSEYKEQVVNLVQKIYNLGQANPITNTLYNKMKIRCWVTMIPCKQIDDCILQLVNQLSLMQAKKKVLEPKKFKKRVVVGFREVKRTLETSLPEKLSKLVIIPINIMECPLEDGPDQWVIDISQLCLSKGIPVVHGSNKTKLGRAYSGKFGPKISAVSVVNYQGTEELFGQIIELKQSQEKLFEQCHNTVNLLKFLK